MYLILECSEADQWPGIHGEHHYLNSPRRIPEGRRPAVLQTDRDIAEREALRLARTHPGRRFVVFAAVAAGITTKIASHQTVGGQTFGEHDVATLVQIGEPESDIPF